MMASLVDFIFVMDLLIGCWFGLFLHAILLRKHFGRLREPRVKKLVLCAIHPEMMAKCYFFLFLKHFFSFSNASSIPN